LGEPPTRTLAECTQGTRSNALSAARVALRERLRSHNRVRIEPLDMRRVCELPDRSTLIGLRDAALLATLASSALRVAELAGLRAKDVVSRRGGWLLLVLGNSDKEVREAPLARDANRADGCLAARSAHVARVRLDERIIDALLLEAFLDPRDAHCR
jgi:site-specific recombinase XerD